MSRPRYRYAITVSYDAGFESYPWRLRVRRYGAGHGDFVEVESTGATHKVYALIAAHLAAWKDARDLRREDNPYKREVTR